MCVLSQDPQQKSGFAQLRGKLSAIVSRRLPASIDYLVATLHTDVRHRLPQHSIDPQFFADSQ